MSLPSLPSDAAQLVILTVLALGYCATSLRAQNPVAIDIQFAAPINVDLEQDQGDGVPTVGTYLDQVKKSEIAFVVRACQLDAEQQKQLEGLGGELKDEIVNKRKQRGGRAGRQGMGQGNVWVNNMQLDISIRTIAKYRLSLQTTFKGALTAEQQPKYDAELEARKEFRKRANAECLVNILDQQVSLQPEQFEPLMESLKNWDGANDLQLAFYFQNGSQNYIPPIPAMYYQKLLTSEQLEILNGCSQVSANRSEFEGDGAFLQW